MEATDEVGAIDRVYGVDYVSNMNDLVYGLEEKVLYMRLSDFNACFDEEYIHSIRLSMIHDIKKDPERAQELDSFYEDGPYKGKDKVYFEHMLGTQRGRCKNIHFEPGESIKAILIRYDDYVIRTLEIKKDNDEIIKLGEYELPDGQKPLWHHVINVGGSHEIIGAYGRTYEIESKNNGAPASHFVSLGFFINKCANPRLEKLAHQAKLRSDAAAAKAAEQMSLIEKIESEEGALVVAIVVLASVLTLLLILCLLRRCGLICQEKKTNFENANSFEEEEEESGQRTNEQNT